MLSPTNALHLYALHYVYKPRINQALKVFVDGWNEHKIRTAKTPNQLFVEGTLRLRDSGSAAVDFFDTVDTAYGVEELGFAMDDDDTGGVEVPQVNFSLEDEHFLQLQDQLNPLQSSDNFGIELYEDTVSFVSRIVQQNPSMYTI